MPERIPTNELRASQSAKMGMPVWAPNPGVPLLARVLAYIFGALMLCTFIAQFTPRAPDIPDFPKTWKSLAMAPGCTLSYPAGWYPFYKDLNKGIVASRATIALLPYEEYPLRIEAVMLKKPENVDSQVLLRGLNEEVQQNLKSRNLDSFTVQGGDESYTSSEVEFTFKEQKDAMSGEWMIIPGDKAILILIGFATDEGWTATKIILRDMASRVQWTSKQTMSGAGDGAGPSARHN